jgi:dual specificity tyrosine-phosphorylation-regulated kinase 2/3/4
MRPSLIIDNRKRVQTFLPVNRSRTSIQVRSDKIKYSLSKEEEKIYGERFPIGYKKLKILGRGGCALVWLGEDSLTGKKVAVKQVSRLSGSNAVDSCKREIHFGTLLNEIPHPALDNIAKLLGSKSDKSDLWALYEVGGSSLSKSLFHVKGEFVKGERMYLIEHPPLYSEFAAVSVLKIFTKELLEIINVLSSLHIVHSDLKSDNILVNEDQYNGIKLIDFGSAYHFLGNGSISTATPEYMPPESLEKSQAPGDHIKDLAHTSQPWSFDIWSAGMILLEIISGIPLWMSLKSRVERHGRLVICRGLLAAQGRDPSMILRLQIEITKDIYNTVKKVSAFDVPYQLVDLIDKMLKWDPMKRISPSQALNHEFFNI